MHPPFSQCLARRTPSSPASLVLQCIRLPSDGRDPSSTRSRVPTLPCSLPPLSLSHSSISSSPKTKKNKQNKTKKTTQNLRGRVCYHLSPNHNFIFLNGQMIWPRILWLEVIYAFGGADCNLCGRCAFPGAGGAGEDGGMGGRGDPRQDEGVLNIPWSHDPDGGLFL